MSDYKDCQMYQNRVVDPQDVIRLERSLIIEMLHVLRKFQSASYERTYVHSLDFLPII